MKLHKTVKKLLKQGYKQLEIKENAIYVTIEHTLSGEDFRMFYDDYSNAFYLDFMSGNGTIIITLTKK